MAVTVVVKKLAVPEVMDVVRELRNQGLSQGVDFDFAYTPSESSDGFSMEPLRERYTTFTFYTEKYATLFALKYGN